MKAEPRCQAKPGATPIRSIAAPFFDGFPNQASLECVGGGHSLGRGGLPCYQAMTRCTHGVSLKHCHGKILAGDLFKSAVVPLRWNLKSKGRDWGQGSGFSARAKPVRRSAAKAPRKASYRRTTYLGSCEGVADMMESELCDG